MKQTSTFAAAYSIGFLPHTDFDSNKTEQLHYIVLICTNYRQSFMSHSKTCVLHCSYIHNVHSVDACYTQHMKLDYVTALL